MADQAEIWRFAANWFRKLDNHSPADELVELVAEDVEFILPEGPLKGREAFRKWYVGVTAIFFDEVHELQSVEICDDAGASDGVPVSVVVRWEASFWRAPSAWSSRLNMTAVQRWTLGRDKPTGKLVIRRYTVDALNPLPGSAPLPTGPANSSRHSVEPRGDAATTPGRKFYEEQIRLLLAGRIEELVETHYADDAILLGNNGQDFVVRCAGDQRPLVEHFQKYLAAIGPLQIKEPPDRFIETEGAILFEASVYPTQLGKWLQVYDAWTLRDGKIAVHFTGLLSSPSSAEPAPTSPSEIIAKYYEFVNAGNWPSWLALFDDGVVGDEQIAGHFQGIEALRGAGDGITKGYKRFQMHPLRVVIDGNHACVIWQCDARNAHEVPIAYPGDPRRPVIGANYFQFAKGKIVAMRTMHDVIPFQPFIQQTRPFQDA